MNAELWIVHGEQIIGSQFLFSCYHLDNFGEVKTDN